MVLPLVFCRKIGSTFPPSVITLHLLIQVSRSVVSTIILRSSEPLVSYLFLWMEAHFPTPCTVVSSLGVDCATHGAKNYIQWTTKM